MANVTVFCFLASYSVAFVLELLRLQKQSLTRFVAGYASAAAGFLAHTFFLWNQGRAAELPPLLSSSRDWTLVLAWLVVGFYLFVITFDRKVSIGVFLLPLVLALVVASHFVASTPNDELLTARHGWTMLHAASLAIGMAGVLAGIVLSVMYLLQHRRLRQKHSGADGLRLPSLERLSRLNWWSVMVSVPLLTLGMGSGLVLKMLGSAESLSLTDPVIVVNGISWLSLTGVFGWMLLTPRASGKQVAWRTLLACGFLLLTVVGLLVLPQIGLESGHGGIVLHDGCLICRGDTL
ncbi:MAG: cytochrome c biogenesis protein CcsA [Planctomycetaceae bacterium]